MSDLFKKSYFHLLPNEVLIKILCDIDTFTLLNFCELYQCDYFLEDKNVIRTLDLCKKYLLTDLKVLYRKITFSHVTTLNINCLYWVAAHVLRKFVIKLVNLKNLYAIKTNLSLTPADAEVYNTIQIEKLAITMRKQDDLTCTKIPSITTLYINFDKVSSSDIHVGIGTRLPNVTKFWFDLEEPSNTSPRFYFRFKDKIFCSINAPTPSIDSDLSVKRYYNNRRPGQCYEMCCERDTLEQMNARKENELSANLGEPWKCLDELHCPVPYGPRDARRLYLNETTLNDILFEELNFHHCGPNCVERRREAEKEILKSSNAKSVRKLCSMTCLLDSKIDTDSVSVQESNGFKRKRIGVVNSVISHSTEDIFENLTKLEYLEIFYCHHFFHSSIVQAYPFIAKFDKLLSLTLEIPVTVDGSFLVKVIKNCKLLESLKITSVAQHETLNFNICNALPDASALKDFRFENHRIPLDKLLERLCRVKTRKLERLVLICNEIDKFSAPPLKELLDSNPQIIFLYFLIRQATQSSLKMAQQTLNVYKKQHPAKILFVKTSIIGEAGYPIPEVHFSEMMRFRSTVAMLQPLDDFDKF